MKGWFILALALSISCSDDDGKKTECQPGDRCFVRDVALNIDNNSRNDEGRSHNMGMNCMQCHQDHGHGKGLFQTAGTVLDVDGKPAVGAKLILYKDAAHTEEVLAIEVDKMGNFFSTKEATFPQDTYPVLISADGSKTTAMPWPTASGACNVCHVGRQKLQFK